MAIFERSAPSFVSVDPRASSDRLRVITAGRVGNMEARLGTSGFDVVAVADSEDALIDALAADDPDAIVVEADLCESLERVHDLAPEAVLIVVGDRTPAGALGRIERGVSGTVMAGLLHALVTEGVGAAVVWGLVPAVPPAAPAHAPAHATSTLLSAKVELVRGHVARIVRGHESLAAAAGAVAVGVTATALLFMGPPRGHERAERPIATMPVVEPATGQPAAPVSPGAPTSTERVSGAPRFRAGPRDAPTSGGAPDRGDRHTPPTDEPPNHEPPEHQPPDDHQQPPQTTSATHPPGVAHGWDVRPPKHGDNGHRNGWTENNGKHHGPRA